MPLTPQPLPWTLLPNREIADGSNNVVQLTPANLGAICLAVNAHDRMLAALGNVEKFLRYYNMVTPEEEVADVLKAVQSAIGKIGSGALVAALEALEAASPEADRAIATELQVPEAAFTGSIDAALSLVPEGWSYRVSMGVLPGTDYTSTSIDMISGNGVKTVKSSSRTMALALCIASIAARSA